MPGKKKTPNNEMDHAQMAYQGIRRMLYHKELIPGQKVAYRELAERLGMSHTPIIQALKWLEIQGFVRHETHRGYFMEPFRLEEVEEIYELRELLEPSLLSDAMGQLDSNGKKKLKAALDAHRSADRESLSQGEVVQKQRVSPDPGCPFGKADPGAVAEKYIRRAFPEIRRELFTGKIS